jgi:hypothetical protein
MTCESLLFPIRNCDGLQKMSVNVRKKQVFFDRFFKIHINEYSAIKNVCHFNSTRHF